MMERQYMTICECGIWMVTTYVPKSIKCKCGNLFKFPLTFDDDLPQSFLYSAKLYTSNDCSNCHKSSDIYVVSYKGFFSNHKLYWCRCCERTLKYFLVQVITSVEEVENMLKEIGL